MHQKIKPFFLLICCCITVFFNCLMEPTEETKPVSGPKLYIAESDYISGQIECMELNSFTIPNAPVTIASDASIFSFNGMIYILEKFLNDNIVKFDPAINDKSGILYQVHLGNNWNPYDLEFVSDTKAYIANQDVPVITIFNPKTGDTTGSINIKQYCYSATDASPYAVDLVSYNNYLYALLQRRVGYTPTGTTLILKINPQNNSIVDTIACKYKNASSSCLVGNLLYIANPNITKVYNDGAIEVVNLDTKEVTTAIDENILGGSPLALVHKSGTIFYTTCYMGSDSIPVLELDLSAGTVLKRLPDVKNVYGGICYDTVDNTLYIGERDRNNIGIKIFKNDIQIGSPVRSSNSLGAIGMTIIR